MQEMDPVLVRPALTLRSGERAWFYAQPRLVSAARNDRVAIVTGLRLEDAGPAGASPAAFVWDEQGTWRYDPVGRGLTWIYVADAAPLVVGPSSPQLPICLFESPPDWRWQAGEFLVTIMAELGEGAAPLRTTFAAELPAQAAELITAQPRTWVEVRTEAIS